MGGMGRGLYICNNTMKKRKKEYNVREMNHMIKKKKNQFTCSHRFSPQEGAQKGDKEKPIQ